MIIDTAAILAGGLATRLRPITEKIPKSLVTVAGQPFIEHQLILLQKHGLRQVVLCLGHLGEQVEALVGDGQRYGLQVTYSHDGPTLAGTGGALQRAMPRLSEVFWVLYGDSYLDFDYRAVANYFEQHCGDKLGLMTVFANQNQWDKSNVLFRDGQLLSYDKRQPTPEMAYIDYGATIMRREALQRITQAQLPYDLADLYYGLVKEGRLAGYEVTQRFYEVGSHTGLAEAEEYLSRNN